MILLVIAISCLSLLFAVYLARYVLRHDMGTDKMQEISNAIKEGAEAFLSRQNRTIILFSSVLAGLIFLLYAFVRTPSPADPGRRRCKWLSGLRSPLCSAPYVQSSPVTSACGCRSAPIFERRRRFDRA